MPTSEKVRVRGSIQDLAILKAIGVNRWGKREVPLSEAEVHWREFLQGLQRRGLKGVELVVSDDHVNCEPLVGPCFLRFLGSDSAHLLRTLRLMSTTGPKPVETRRHLQLPLRLGCRAISQR